MNLMVPSPGIDAYLSVILKYVVFIVYLLFTLCWLV